MHVRRIGIIAAMVGIAVILAVVTFGQASGQSKISPLLDPRCCQQNWPPKPGDIVNLSGNVFVQPGTSFVIFTVPSTKFLVVTDLEFYHGSTGGGVELIENLAGTVTIKRQQRFLPYNQNTVVRPTVGLVFAPTSSMAWRNPTNVQTEVFYEITGYLSPP